MSMETAVLSTFKKRPAEAGGGGNKPWRGASALRERHMAELVRSWDDARTEASMSDMPASVERTPTLLRTWRGPSGMRNENLRCLVGEYAPASGHAAVRAMSEVASCASKLGVGICAVDYVLIHAEKLGPRAVIIYTDLRNAYNEAWRRTIIHIDCSPLQLVMLALLASLSTASFLPVDDRSAPLRSEDGVQ
eukprot:jgi/Tetstr1/456985/TSEL_043650.t1